MRFAVIVFPGSNCDRDCEHVLKNVLGQEVTMVFHKERRLPKTDCVILPGGFSYGDYLRPGAIARFSPIVEDVVRFCEAGGLVLGICNGFQTLVEAGLLPGALMQNRSGRFVCKDTFVRVENQDSPLTLLTREGQILRLPIAHAEGLYFAREEVLAEMKRHGQILFRYVDEKGHVTDRANPNGSVENIAGVMNKEKNCFGMMPHPERASEKILGSEDGKVLFESLIAWHGGLRR